MLGKLRDYISDSKQISKVERIEPSIAPVERIVKVRDGGTFFNTISGVGGQSDKTNKYYWGTNAIYWDFALLENVYINSWATKKLIHIPVEDMLMIPRIITDVDDNVQEEISEVYEQLEIESQVMQAMISARLFGTALIVIVSQDGRMDTPLNIDNIGIDDLKNIVVVDRFRASVLSRTTDIRSRNFQKPEFYNVYFKFIGSIKVHYTRIIRVDGIKPLNNNLWQNYAVDWGISELIPAWSAITADEGMATNVDQLFQEYSIPVYKAKGIAESLSGSIDADADVNAMASKVNIMKSNFKTLYCDIDSDVKRLDVSFRQIPELMDRMAQRVAAAGDIPFTRFFGQSPAGMDATGDSDMANYAIMVSSMQRRLLAPIYKRIDELVAKTIGYKDKINFMFPKLVDISENELSQAYLQRAQGDQIYVNMGAVAEDEVRQNLANSDAFEADLTKPIDKDEPSPDQVNAIAQKIANANKSMMQPTEKPAQEKQEE